MQMSHTGSPSHVMQIVASTVQGMLAELTPPSTECCIYKVPRKLYDVKKEAYEPRLLSIGPLHRGKEHLVAMEEYKLRYLKKFLSSIKITIQDFLKIISMLETRIRESYSESITLSSENFLKMFLVDGCFIIELVLCSSFPEMREPNDWIFSKPSLLYDVFRDMMLLENQLPFFLLLSFYDLAYPGVGNLGNRQFLICCIKFFDQYLGMPNADSTEDLNELVQKISTVEIQHFVDLLWLCHRPSSLRRRKDDNDSYPIISIPTATVLHEAGVRFKRGAKNKPLLDVVFEEGVLKIPQLCLGDHFECLFRNLIAFEQYHYPKDSYIIDYITIMDYLINTTKDVDLLVKKEIIDNCLGDNVAVTNLFNNLLIETVYEDDFYFGHLFERLNEYYKVTWHSWKATLRHQYFSSPWRGASTIAAVILLVLTLIQTIFSGMSSK